MNHKSLSTGIGALLGMGILILDSKTALAGAREGIFLCTQTIIPSLFPFFVLSATVNRCFLGNTGAFLRPLGRAFQLPRGSESILVSAFLGGYPVGAQAVARAFHDRQLNQQEAQRLLAFCNNPGPAFLFGMVGGIFDDKSYIWLLWAILIISALATARMTPSAQDFVPTSLQTHSGKRILSDSIKAMVSVCAWVILFRVVIAFCSRWFLWLIPDALAVLFIGLLELSNGCMALTSLGQPYLRFVMCACMLSFGGICVTMQTFSVTEGLSKRQYFLGKGMQTLFTLLFSVCAVRKQWILLGVLTAVVLFFPGKTKKAVAFPEKL